MDFRFLSLFFGMLDLSVVPDMLTDLALIALMTLSLDFYECTVEFLSIFPIFFSLRSPYRCLFAIS